MASAGTPSVCFGESAFPTMYRNPKALPTRYTPYASGVAYREGCVSITGNSGGRVMNKSQRQAVPYVPSTFLIEANVP